MTANDVRSEVDRGLNQRLQRARLRNLVYGLLSLVAIVGGAALLAGWTLAEVLVPAPLRYGLSALWVALLAVTLYTVWWSPWRRSRSSYSLR